MPALAKLPRLAAPFHHMALEVHKLLNKPLGTEHARVLKLAEVLKNLAETNYQRGHEDAMASLEIVPEEVESERAIYNASKDVAIAFMEANPTEQFRVSIQAKAEPVVPKSGPTEGYVLIGIFTPGNVIMDQFKSDVYDKITCEIRGEGLVEVWGPRTA